jgi:hypothetical protein
MQHFYSRPQGGLRRQSPALETPLPHFVSPVGERGQVSVLGGLLKAVATDLLLLARSVPGSGPSHPLATTTQDIMLIWDFQNVRLPNELEPQTVIKWVC